MKNKIPSEGLRLGRDSGSILCDTLKKVAFSDSLGGGKTDDADLAAGLRLVAKVSLVYVFEAFIITFIDLMTAKVQRFFETTKDFGYFFEKC